MIKVADREAVPELGKTHRAKSMAHCYILQRQFSINDH